MPLLFYTFSFCTSRSAILPMYMFMLSLVYKSFKVYCLNLLISPALKFIRHSLQYLRLKNGCLQPDNNFLASCRSLQSLWMVDIKLQSLSIGLHGITASIEVMRLFKNNITSLSEMENLVFHRLRSLDLQNNRIMYLKEHLLKFFGTETFGFKR